MCVNSTELNFTAVEKLGNLKSWQATEALSVLLVEKVLISSLQS